MGKKENLNILLLTGINILLHNFTFSSFKNSSEVKGARYHLVTWKITFSYLKNKKLLKKETEHQTSR